MYDNLNEIGKLNVLTHTLKTVLGANATSQFLATKFMKEFERQCKLECKAGNTKKKDYSSLNEFEKKKIINTMKKRSSTFKQIYNYYRHTNKGTREIARELRVNAGTVSKIMNKINELKF